MVDKKIKVELDDEMNLEDLILLGEDKLFNIHIEYPKEDENGEFIIVKSKAKIKQLTLKEIRNINLKNITLLSSFVINTLFLLKPILYLSR